MHVPKGCLIVRVVIDKAQRGQGYARMLAASIQQKGKEFGASQMETMVRDTDHEARAWAERLGYSPTFHRFESVLDLTRFDPDAHAGARAAAHNLSINGPMLAVSDRLGYARLPGIWVMRKSLA